MKYTPRQYAQALHKSLSENADRSLVLDSFAKMLADNNDANLYEEVAREYEKLSLAARGIKPVEVEVSRELTEAEIKRIKEAVGKWLKQEVEVFVKVEPALLGGLKLKLDDWSVNLSVKGYLEQLKNNLEA